MSINSRENSRYKGQPVKLYLFKGVEASLESLIKSVCIIPGSSEFGYGTTLVTSGDGRQVNKLARAGTTDFVRSIDDLLSAAQNLSHVTIFVTWYGTDLRAGNCQIRPMVISSGRTTIPYSWQVGPVVRSSATVVSQFDGRPAYAGTPSDRTVFEAITHLKSKGLKVTVCPLLLMNIPDGNTLPNPYGGTGQTAYPSRSKISCHPAPGVAGSVDNTATADTQLATFFGTVTAANFSWNTSEQRVNYSGVSTEWSYMRFVLHVGTIAAAAGADDFLIGSGMSGLTKVRSSATVFPAISRLQTLAARVRNLVGATMKLSYAADWSEYHSHKSGTNLVFNMDALWADVNISYIGINNYFPVGDWRTGNNHLDKIAGFNSQYDREYIESNIEGGEYFDWLYATQADRDNQVRTPITDPAYNEPWVWRLKDVRSWATNEHFNRIAGVKSATKTSYVPGSKKIVFTELGFPSIEKAINQPSLILDSKSSESGSPFYSDGSSDETIQRVANSAVLNYWKKNAGTVIDSEKISVMGWDARPYPLFPEREDYFVDTASWSYGYWLNGRLKPGFGFDAGSFGPFAFCDGEEPITRAGITYEPFPIQMSDLSSDGTLDKSDITISMARGSDLESEFIGSQPSHVVNLIVFQGHVDDPVTLANYPAAWVGRIGAPIFENTEVKYNCVPVSTSIQRPGLRRNYQLTCPHVLYGPHCRASKKQFTVSNLVVGLTGSVVELNVGLTAHTKYLGGTIEWTHNESTSIRTIIAIDSSGRFLTVRGNLRGMNINTNVKISFGCKRTTLECKDKFGNILNFGGQPTIPLENPMSSKNFFF